MRLSEQRVLLSVPWSGDAGRDPGRWSLGRVLPGYGGTEEAIVNALFAAQTMTGRDGNTVHALPRQPVVRALAGDAP